MRNPDLGIRFVYMRVMRDAKPSTKFFSVPMGCRGNAKAAVLDFRFRLAMLTSLQSTNFGTGKAGSGSWGGR